MGRTLYLSRWKDEYATSFIPEATTEQLAYLAGIIDGEGFFQVSTKSNTFGLGVSVTDRCLIEYLRETFGGRAYFDIDQTTANRLVHRWFVSRHADLAHLLPLLRPYLVIKREQADAMIELVSHLQNAPKYDVPTSHSPPRVREERRKKRLEWTEGAKDLRLAVRGARYAQDAVAR